MSCFIRKKRHFQKEIKELGSCHNTPTTYNISVHIVLQIFYWLFFHYFLQLIFRLTLLTSAAKSNEQFKLIKNYAALLLPWMPFSNRQSPSVLISEQKNSGGALATPESPLSMKLVIFKQFNGLQKLSRGKKPSIQYGVRQGITLVPQYGAGHFLSSFLNKQISEVLWQPQNPRYLRNR